MTATTNLPDPIVVLRMLIENQAWETRCDPAWTLAERVIEAHDKERLHRNDGIGVYGRVYSLRR